MSDDVALLLVALLPPIVGNLILIFSDEWLLSQLGCYLYYAGIDWSVIVVLRFSCIYCSVPYVGTKWRIVANALIAIDVVQLLLNPLTGHAFTTVETVVDGAAYYALVPFAGQAFHRIIAYGIFFVALGIVAYKTFTASRLYVERYLVLLLCMLVCCIWETYYIFSGAPIDRSMIGFGVYGLLVYYLVLYYRPMRLLDRMLARVVEDMDAAFFFFDVNMKCIYCNSYARNVIEVEEGEDLPANITETIGKSIGGWGGRFDDDWSKQAKVRHGSEERYLEIRSQQVYDDRKRRVGVCLSIRDATEDQMKLAHEKYLASHDLLTGLYNQHHLYERIRAELDANNDVDYKIIGIDIKDFKIVNDIFDKEFGDQVLRAVGDELRAHCKPGAVYGRLTGDKFGVLAPIGDFSEAEMEDLLTVQSFGKRLANYPIVVHMGVYEVADRSLDVSVMFDRAFMAITSIKNDLNTHVATYDEGMRQDLIWNQTISQQLERAIAERQIIPYLQPMVDVGGEVEGAEVLVRWIHPTEGLLSPARFIPVFENNGMIAQLDAYMWECACEILHDWQMRGIDLFLSVNISPKDFYFIDVYGTIRGLVKKHDINPRKLRLEITETAMMTDIENRLRIIEDLRADGFLVEMDDFGSGYSSLNMLKDIPVDVLKIDMMFLYKTKDQTKAATILQTIINLSGQLGIPSITEGVETADQLDMLVNMGCRLFQGYYFAKPMPVAEFEARYRAA